MRVSRGAGYVDASPQLTRATVTLEGGGGGLVADADEADEADEAEEAEEEEDVEGCIKTVTGVSKVS